MKKIVAIVLGLVLLGAGIYIALRRGGEGNEYARYLPRDAVATLNLLHLNELTDTFASTSLGQFLAKDTMHAVIGEMGGSASDLAEYDRMFDSVAEVMTNPAFRAVFGEDATVALLPPETGDLGAKPLESLRGGLVVVARTTVAGALDLFSRMIKNANISRVVVDELELTKVVLDSRQVLYGYTEGKMVFLAYSPAAIKQCLLAANKDGHRLEGKENFAQAVAYWRTIPQKETYCRLFADPPGLSRLLAGTSTHELRRSAIMLQGINAIYAMAYAGDRGIESRARATYQYDQLDRVVRTAVDAATSPNPTLFLLQEDSLAYSWASALRPELITRTLAENDLEYQQIETSVRGLLGVGLEELGRAFGPQYGMVLDDIVRVALFPTPKMTFFVSLRDRAIAQKVVETIRVKIAESGMIREERELIAGHTVSFWPLLSDKDAQPTLAMTETMLYLSTSKQALKRVLETTASPDSLAKPVAIRLGDSLAKRVATANTGSLVIYPRRMSRQAGETLDWLAGILTATRNISISRLNQEMVRMLQSTEIMAATSEMTRERADWSMSLYRDQTQDGAAAARK